MKKTDIKKLDKLWSLKVKERAKFKCEYCLAGEDKILNSCHIIGRRNRSTRWDLENGMCLCYSHHMAYDHHLPQHEDIRNEVIGQKRITRLTKKRNVIAKNQDYETIKEELCQD